MIYLKGAEITAGTSLPVIAITMGDSAGVGPEICLRTLAEEALLQYCAPIVLGDAALLRRTAAVCRLSAPETVFSDPETLHDIQTPAVFDLKAIDADAVTPGRVDAAT
jgi:4-hydroxy-L-threonine phosphate dehydrogenase PdxA